MPSLVAALACVFPREDRAGPRFTVAGVTCPFDLSRRNRVNSITQSSFASPSGVGTANDTSEALSNRRQRAAMGSSFLAYVRWSAVKLDVQLALWSVFHV